MVSQEEPSTGASRLARDNMPRREPATSKMVSTVREAGPTPDAIGPGLGTTLRLHAGVRRVRIGHEPFAGRHSSAYSLRRERGSRESAHAFFRVARLLASPRRSSRR